jgi:cytochrome b involved in lipid metabolism
MQLQIDRSKTDNEFSGGEEVLLDVGGQDATEAFEDVGHSDEAREILDGLVVGNLKRMVCYDISTMSLKTI